MRCLGGSGTFADLMFSSTYGFSRRRLLIGKLNACVRLVMTINSACTAAPGSACPKAALSAHNTKGPRLTFELVSTAHAAPSSMGSPKEVPVPCI